MSHSLKKRKDGIMVEADNFYATSDPKTFKKLSGSDIFDLIINTLAIEIECDDYLGLLGLDGTMVVVGIPEKQTPINLSTLIMARRNLAGSVIGGIRETQEMLNFCSKYNIANDIEVTPIHKVNEAYERVVKSDVRYRFVIDMKSLLLCSQEYKNSQIWVREKFGSRPTYYCKILYGTLANFLNFSIIRPEEIHCSQVSDIVNSEVVSRFHKNEKV
jgi:hypothetical protein